MLNPLFDTLPAYPFTGLNALLQGVAPPPGYRPIDMAVGDPQHAAPALLADTVARHAADWNRYPPMSGTLELRQAIAEWLTRRYRLAPGMVSPDHHVAPLAGSREGIVLFASLAIPRRKNGMRPVVLMPNPHFLIYNSAATLAGAEPVFLPATRDNGFLPDLDAIPAETLDRAALFYLCSPSNPEGSFADLEYLKRAIGLARRHDFVLVVDECYSEIYDREPPPGALKACAAVGRGFDGVVVFHSLSKRSSAAGMRSAFAAGDPKLIGDFARLRSYHGIHVPLPVQAAAAALWRDERHVEENRAKYRRKFDLAEGALAGKFGFYRPPGGFFLWLDVGDGEKAALRLWREAGLRALPGGYLAVAPNGADNPARQYLRLALVHSEPTVEDACRRIVRVLEPGVSSPLAGARDEPITPEAVR